MAVEKSEKENQIEFIIATYMSRECSLAKSNECEEEKSMCSSTKQ